LWCRGSNPCGARVFSHAKDDSELFGDLVQKHDDVIGADPEDEQRFDVLLTARQIETLCRWQASPRVLVR